MASVTFDNLDNPRLHSGALKGYFPANCLTLETAPFSNFHKESVVLVKALSV